MSRFTFITSPPGKKFKDLSGIKVNRLTVTKFLGYDRKCGSIYECKCDCGAVTMVRRGHLTEKRIKSCGCWLKDITPPNLRHGKTKTPEYQVWLGIKKRCNNPKSIAYRLYGGRGIKIHPCWESDFEAFLAEVGRRPSPRHSIERIDNNAGYQPGNCKWATQFEQSRNTRRVVWVQIDGNTMPLKDAAESLRVNYHGLQKRSRAARQSGSTTFTSKGRILEIVEHPKA